MMRRGAITAAEIDRDGARQVPVESLNVSETAKIGVIEDDAKLLRALVLQLSTAGFRVTTCSSAEQFLAADDVSEFDCILADMYLPGMNGLQLQEELRRTVPLTSVIFITGHGELSIALCAIRQGATDFLEKPFADDMLLNAIRQGVKLSRAQRETHFRRIELEKRHDTLTPREREVFALVTAGLLNKQAGAKLGTTERTIKAHRERVMRKMRAGSLADLVGMAVVLQISKQIVLSLNAGVRSA
jgi:FixJ family two-component response regulator